MQCARLLVAGGLRHERHQHARRGAGCGGAAVRHSRLGVHRTAKRRAPHARAAELRARPRGRPQRQRHARPALPQGHWPGGSQQRALPCCFVPRRCLHARHALHARWTMVPFEALCCAHSALQRRSPVHIAVTAHAAASREYASGAAAVLLRHACIPAAAEDIVTELATPAAGGNFARNRWPRGSALPCRRARSC